jgi:hypothetical protein
VPPRLQQCVVEEFADWAAARGIVSSGEAGQRWRERISLLLQCRVGYLGRPDPTCWRSGDVRDLFMNHVVPRQVDDWGLAEHGVDTIRDYLRFLDSTDRLHPTSARVPALLKELDRLAPKYPAAMADTSRWRLAKRVFTAILADGITLDAEPAVLDAWAERFSARDPDGRRAVLGELMDEDPGFATGRLLIHDCQVAMLQPWASPVKHVIWPNLACDCGCSQPQRFPPVTLPDTAVLAKMVATDGAGLLRELAALAGWVGDTGRAVDHRGEPRNADRLDLLTVLGLPAGKEQAAMAPALTRLWRIAIEFDVIQLRRTRVIPGAGAGLVTAALAGDATPTQALDLWSGLADALIHPPDPVSIPKGGDHLREWLKPWAPRSLGMLYATSVTGKPTDLDTLTEQLLAEFAHRLPPSEIDLFAGFATMSVRNTLADLANHGAVTVAGASIGHDPRYGAIAAVLGTTTRALSPTPGITVDLTDLGRYLIRQRLLAENAYVPLTD